MAIADGYPKLLRADADWSIGDDGRADRKYSVEWVVLSTMNNDLGATILSAGIASADFPSYGDTYAYGNDSDAYAICRRLRAVRNAPQTEPREWRVFAEFGRRGLPPDEPADPTQPWTRNTRWSIQQGDYVEECVTDTGGNAIKNSAGQKYSTPLEKDAARTLIHVTYYKQSLKVSVLDTFRKAINSNSQWGYAAEKLRMNTLTAEEQYENGLYYWEIRAAIEANQDTWVKTAIESGMLAWNGTAWVLPTDGNSTVYVQERLLDATGALLAHGSAPVEKDWDIYDQQDFSSADLGLPAFPSHLTYS